MVDGTEASGTVPNAQAIVRFDLNGILPTDAELQTARLVTVTGNTAVSGTSDINNIDGNIAVRQMLVDWDLDAGDATLPTLPSEFGSERGIQVSEGEASSIFVDMNGNLLDGSSNSNLGFDGLASGEEYVFDVTLIVQDWLENGNNYGFLINKKNTNGWEFLVDDIRLELSYTTPVPEPVSLTSATLIGFLLLARRRKSY